MKVIGILAIIVLTSSIQDGCETILCPNVEGYNYLKSFQLPFVEDKKTFEYSYVFSKDTDYIISLTPDQQVTLPSFEFFNSKRDRIVSLTSNTDRIAQVKFHCSASGIYYLRFADTRTCSAAWVGFKRRV